MIVYKFKVIFEDVDDVERHIEIRANQTFSDLYRSIVESIKFDPNITASFYMSGDNWRKGKEITNAEKAEVLQMADAKLNSFVNDPHQKILLITHDEMEWTLRVQLFGFQKDNGTDAFPKLVKSVGEAPKQKKITTIGLATNEFEKMVDEIVSEAEEPDVSEMGFDDEMGNDFSDDDERGEDEDEFDGDEEGDDDGGFDDFDDSDDQ
ncbi:MAG: hypothetical protein H6607_05425 [Flavobacteriales bacterium]|nr:hypothetical protein [Flavobacteriales bacterium]